MRRQLSEAARACRSTTFADARDQLTFIQSLAFSVAIEFNRLVRVEVEGRAVVVKFTASPGPRAA